jgi:hypothetical protein
MKLAVIKKVAKRIPFRPFKVRLSNGAKYEFSEEWQFGAPQDLHVICFFGQKELVLIDPDQIVEVVDMAA